MQVEIKPVMFRWARERAGLTPRNAEKRFPKLADWEDGRLLPSLKQVEHFAKAVHVPVGYLFLSEPPEETIPVPDLRTMGPGLSRRPSPELLETIYLCQQRQEWFHDYAKLQKQDRLSFVGSARPGSNVVSTASRIRSALGLDLEHRRETPTWTEALRRLIAQADELGVLVMVNGVVGNNNKRPLNPDEFRGFALSDPLAPLVFINGADSKSAQMFTLVHELAHLWLAKSGVTDAGADHLPDQEMERWCNAVAAEVLVPLESFKAEHRRNETVPDELRRLARHYKVSTLVVLRRVFDMGRLSRQDFHDEYEAELQRLKDVTRSSGGDFYLTQGARVGKRFARALIASTYEGHTLHRDAFHLLGFSKLSTFEKWGSQLGIVV